MKSNKNYSATFNSSYNTIDEWYINNKKQYFMTRDKGFCAEKLIELSNGMQEAAAELIKKRKDETEWRLIERIREIEHTKKELENVRKLLQDEIEVFDIIQGRIEDEIKCVKLNSKDIVERCQQLRYLKSHRNAKGSLKYILTIIQ